MIKIQISSLQSGKSTESIHTYEHKHKQTNICMKQLIIQNIFYLSSILSVLASDDSYVRCVTGQQCVVHNQVVMKDTKIL